MTIKWDEKMVMEHAKELKSPFETLKQPTGPDGVLQAIRARGNGKEQPIEES